MVVDREQNESRPFGAGGREPARSPAPLILEFPVRGMDFVSAGDAAAKVKKTLIQVGMPDGVVRRAAIATYEAEMNIVIHAREGAIKASITSDQVEIVATDVGPGITDISLAMQEGYSTAPPHIREMGFGAGMGLPNIKRCADELDIQSEVGKGTQVRIIIKRSGEGQ